MLTKARFVDLLAADGRPSDGATSAYDYFATEFAKWTERLPDLNPLCERILSRIIDTEYDVTKDGKKGIGRMNTIIPRLIAEFPALRSSELLVYARTRSQEAAVGGVVATLGSVMIGAAPTNARTPSEDALWQDTIPRLNEGAADAESAASAQQPFAMTMFSLGTGAARLIEQEAQRTGVALFEGIRKNKRRQLFTRIMVFHATFGWTVVSSAISLIRRA